MADDETALIMACADGGQADLVQPLLERKSYDRIEALEAALREILQVGSATENLALWVAQDIASHALAGEKKDGD